MYMCSDIYLLWILSGVNGWLLLGLGVLLDRLIGLRMTSIVLFSIFKSFDCPDIYKPIEFHSYHLHIAESVRILTHSSCSSS